MKLGVHESVEAVFPPSELVAELSDDAASGAAGESAGGDTLEAAGESASANGLAGAEHVAVVGDDAVELGEFDAVVTFEHVDAFLETVGWVHSIQAGVDRFPAAEYEAAGVSLTSSTGIHGESVGESVVGYLTALARGLHRYRSAQERSEWVDPEWDRPFTLAGETICVVGLGTIGQAVAERATWLDMDVVGVRQSPEPAPIVDEVYTAEELHKPLVDARFVVLAVPLTADTRRLIGPAEIAAMRDDAFLINVARGDVVVQDALVDALQVGDLAGAALDVFQEEPLPENSPLWDREDVIVTPHAAGRSDDYHEQVAGIVRDNCERFAEDRALRNQVV